MPPPAFVQHAHQVLTLIGQFDQGMNALSAQDRGRIVDNIYTLWNSHTGGAYYQNFFQEIDQILTGIPANQIPNHRLRLSAIFSSKLRATYVNDHSLGGYLGGASEILDTVRSLTRAAAPTNVSVPTAHKTYDQMDFQPLNPNTAVPDQTLQDVDRTEIHPGANGQPGIKYYIEVKADAHTAVHKISSNSGVTQLEGIRAVINNRVRRSLMVNHVAMHHFNRHGRVLRPAIALTNPAGWLEIFTSGVVLLYTGRQFWLMVGGQIISPADQNTIYASIWTLLGLPNPPRNYFELRNNAHRASQLALRGFLASDGATFPSPAQLAANNWTVAGLVAAPLPAQPVPQPPPPPP